MKGSVMNSFFKWFLIILSAIIYPIPFLYSPALWWLSFIYLIPLFVAALQYKLSFKEGFLWATIILIGHLYGVFSGICSMATGSSLAKMIPVLICILTEALYGGIWFYVTTYILKQVYHRTSLTSPFMTLLIWSFTSWLYILFMDSACLWLFNICEGYFALHPLLPLVIHPQLLWFVPFIGKAAASLIFVITSACLTAFIMTPTWHNIFLALIIGSFWLMGYVIHPKKLPSPSWLDEIGVLNITVYSNINLSFIGSLIQEQCQQFIAHYPDIKVILFPESALYCTQLTTVPEMISAWDSNQLGTCVDMIIGAFRWEENNYRNTAHWIRDGKLQQLFDKRHAMILTEHVPNFNSSFLKNLFFNQNPDAKLHRWPVTPSTNARPAWQLLPDLTVVPYICSELFFNHHPDDIYLKLPILEVCNDSWTSARYVKNFMYLEARLKALLWQRDIIYVSYEYQKLIRPDGSIHQLIVAYPSSSYDT